jgi:hypothetical protein
LRGGGRKSSRDVIRQRGALEGGLVAAEAVRGFEKVVVVDVAGGTRRRRGRHVRSGQGKPGDAVIERGCIPTHCGMASGAAGCRECGSGGGVRRGVGVLPVGQMAAGGSASVWGDSQRIVVTGVTQIAGHVGVPVGEQEAGGAVIKNAGSPGGNGMAEGTLCCSGWKSSGDVIRQRGALESGLVAAKAVRGFEEVVVADMAGGAGSW